MRRNQVTILDLLLRFIPVLVVTASLINLSSFCSPTSAAPSQIKFSAGDATPGDWFGFSVAISGDTAIVGAAAQSESAGAAYIYTRNGASWTPQAKLTPSEVAPGDHFGWSVAINGDSAVVGAYSKANNIGAAYVFTRSGTVWSQQGALTPSDAVPGDQFGYHVAINGETVVVGAPNGPTGKAYIFVRNGSTWTQQTKLAPADLSLRDTFGFTVGISGDTAIIGAVHRSLTGAAYVFVRSGTAWSQQAILVPPGAAAGDWVGDKLAISGDLAILGAPGTTGNTGAAYVYIRSGTTWNLEAKLNASDGAVNDWFGYTVGLTKDMAVVGAYNNQGGKGATYIFMRSGSGWSQLTKLVASDAAVGDKYGWSVAISGDTILSGASRWITPDAGPGSVYAYWDPIPPAVTTNSSSTISTSQATLNGSLTSLGSATGAIVSFEYGTSTTYGSATSVQTFGATGPFSASVTGLSPGTTYHFRAKADGGARGVATGTDVTFSTPALPVTTTIGSPAPTKTTSSSNGVSSILIVIGIGALVVLGIILLAMRRKKK